MILLIYVVKKIIIAFIVSILERVDRMELKERSI